MWHVVKTIADEFPKCTAVPMNWVIKCDQPGTHLRWPRLYEEVSKGCKLGCKARIEVRENLLSFPGRILYQNLSKYHKTKKNSTNLAQKTNVCLQ